MPLKENGGEFRSVKRLIRILWSYRIAQSNTVPYPPYRLWVEPTAVCNIRCSYCPNKELIKQQNVGFMSFSLFQKIIDEARGWVHDINVHHRGESLLHPQFIDMVNYAGANGVFTKLHTNATRLNHKMSEAILDSSLDLISFSFDGFEKATYERYRQPAGFDPVLDNILEFLRLKERRGQRKPSWWTRLHGGGSRVRSHGFGRRTSYPFPRPKASPLMRRIFWTYWTWPESWSWGRRR